MTSVRHSSKMCSFQVLASAILVAFVAMPDWSSAQEPFGSFGAEAPRTVNSAADELTLSTSVEPGANKLGEFGEVTETSGWDSANRVSSTTRHTKTGSPSSGASTSSLSLAERYLKAISDLKLAEIRFAQQAQAGGTAHEADWQVAATELERARKLESVMKIFINGEVAVERGNAAVAEAEWLRVNELFEKGEAPRSQLFLSKAQFDLAKARAEELRSIAQILWSTETTWKSTGLDSMMLGPQAPKAAAGSLEGGDGAAGPKR